MEHTGSDQSIAEYSVHRAIAEGRTLDDAIGAYFAAADAQSRADTHTGGSRHTGSSGSSHFAGRITNMYDQDPRRFGPVEEQPNISVGVATGNGTSSSAGNVPLQAQQVHLTHAQNAKHGDQGVGTDDQGGQGEGGQGKKEGREKEGKEKEGREKEDREKEGREKEDVDSEKDLPPLFPLSSPSLSHYTYSAGEQ
jgi:hypothetical protein